MATLSIHIAQTMLPELPAQVEAGEEILPTEDGLLIGNRCRIGRRHRSVSSGHFAVSFRSDRIFEELPGEELAGRE